MFKMKKLLVTLFLFVSFVLKGTTYYTAKTGSDTNSGTFTSPFLTIQYGINRLRVGDTLFVRQGIYYEKLSVLSYSGTASDPIVISAYPGESPIIDGTGINLGGVGNAFIYVYASYIRINGFEVRNVDMTGLYNDSYAVFLNGHNILSNCTIHDTWKGGVLLWNDYNVIEYCTVYRCSMANSNGVIGSGNAWGIGVRGNTGSSTTCNYNIVRHCTIHTIWGETLSTVYSQHTTIEDCVVYQGGIYLCNAQYTLVQRNLVYMTDVTAMGEFHYMGIGCADEYVGNVNSDNTIINNIVYGNQNNFFTNSMTNYVVANNTFVNAWGEFGVMIYPGFSHSNSYFVNNIIIQEDASQCIYYSGTGGITFSNNLWNKSPIAAAQGSGDVVTTTHITKEGSYTSSFYYKLLSNSTAINAGIDINVDYDFGNVARILPDIGAWEYGSNPETKKQTIISDGYIITLGNSHITFRSDSITPPTPSGEDQIIADHTIVDRYDDIPPEYLAEVKKMWAVNAGESHSYGVRYGMALLEALNSNYNSNVRESGTPDAYTTENLRFSSGTWGDYSNASGWIYNYGEEDWFTNSTALSRTKAGLSYCNTHGLTIGAFGFGWCWDPQGLSFVEGLGENPDPVYGVHWYGVSKMGPQGDRGWGLDDADYDITANTINLDTYLEATQEYVDYCKANGYSTKIYFTTGPVDAIYGEAGYCAYLKYERIRNYIKADSTRILFDYADILCYDDNGIQTTTTWNEHTYPRITTINQGAADIAHISDAGCLRLAKAMWWMLARIAGWDGK